MGNFQQSLVQNLMLKLLGGRLGRHHTYSHRGIGLKIIHFTLKIMGVTVPTYVQVRDPFSTLAFFIQSRCIYSTPI